MRFIWVQVRRRAGDYNQLDDLAEAAEYMALFGVRYVYRTQKYGVAAKWFTGNNYISMFFGDGESQPTRELSNNEIRFLNGRLCKMQRERR